MFPQTLALVDDDDAVYTEILAHVLKGRGCRVDVFGDSNELLAHAHAFDYDFYILDLMLPGVGGVDLIKVLRQRSTAGMLVVSGRLAPEVFADVVGAGADMYLGKPLDAEQVVLAVQAVQRRALTASRANTPWRLERRARQLTAPDGARVDLSEGDLALLECFVEAEGAAVTREALRLCLGHTSGADATDSLNSTIHRLKRRIERATQGAAPLQSKSKVGYVFRAPLKAS